MTETTTETTPATTSPGPTVWPTLSYDDAAAAIEFLTSVFGFVSKAVYYADDDKTRVVHAQLDWPAGGGVMLGSTPRPEGWPDIRGCASAYCVVETDDTVDEVFAKATAAGVTVLREPTDEDYGGRGCAVLDPEGNQWSFGSYRGE